MPVDASEVERVKPHFCRQQSRLRDRIGLTRKRSTSFVPHIARHKIGTDYLRGRMAERVNLPADSGFVVELILQESVTERGVFNHAHIVCAGLVVHRPATIDKLISVGQGRLTEPLTVGGIACPP